MYVRARVRAERLNSNIRINTNYEYQKLQSIIIKHIDQHYDNKCRILFDTPDILNPQYK